MAIFLGLVQFRQTSPNVWYHIALVRDNGIFKLFVNGILKGSAGYNIDLDYFSNMPFEIGYQSYGTQRYPLIGAIDELRIDNGIARYSTNFTPPTTPYT